MPLKDGSYKGPHWSTRRALLEMLKSEGERTSQEMAEVLGVSRMAVRQHMQELEEAGDVVSRDCPSGKGRPAKRWTLTPKAERHFPDRHRDLVLDLLRSMQSVLGDGAMDRLLDERSVQQRRAYSRRLEGRNSVAARVEALAAIRSEEGYMAESHRDESGAYWLAENHCPICSAAEACAGLCARELDVFRATLGPDAKVERVEHLLAGGRRCLYRIEDHSRT